MITAQKMHGKTGSTTALFKLERVTKYRQISATSRVTVLQNVFAQVDKGSLITIIGPSGAGKSTLLSLFNRLEDVDGGKIFYRGKELREWDVLELRRQVGLVFQRPVMLPGTVLDNLLYGPRIRGKQPEMTPAELMEMVGLDTELLNRNAQNLSGGQQQRVALARTLANGPRILLLDEITASLDPKSAAAVENLIIRLNRERGYTCLWVTHDREQARRVSNYTWLLQNGKIEVIFDR